MKKYLPGPEPYTLQFEVIGGAASGFKNLFSNFFFKKTPIDFKGLFPIYKLESHSV